MALIHGPIKDTDPHFIIDPVTRKLSTESAKITLVQGDHNSERFTFEVPQAVEGHRMGESDKIEIHYINVDQMTKETSPGVYVADDVAVTPGEDGKPGKVTFSWLIDNAATRYQGALNFVVRFVCTEGIRISYAWNTAIHTGIAITNGINNGEMLVAEYSDILKKWESELKANQVVRLEQTSISEDDAGENVWTATFGDGRQSELKVKNGSRGPKGYIGSIETLKGTPLHFFVGTRDEYNALTDAQRENLFAILTDDTADEGLLADIEAIKETNSTQSGDIKALKTWKKNLGVATETSDGFMSAQDKKNLRRVLPIETVGNGYDMNGGPIPEKGWYYGLIYDNGEYYNVPTFRWDGEAENVAACFPYVLKITREGRCDVHAYATATSTESLNQFFTPTLRSVTSAELYIFAIKYQEATN